MLWTLVSPHQTGNLPQTDFADLGINEFVGCINLHARHNVTTVWLLEQEIILILGDATQFHIFYFNTTSIGIN